MGKKISSFLDELDHLEQFEHFFKNQKIGGWWVSFGCCARKRGTPKLGFSLGCAGIQYSINVFYKLIVVNNCSPEVSSADETQTKTYHINPICQT